MTLVLFVVGVLLCVGAVLTTVIALYLLALTAAALFGSRLKRRVIASQPLPRRFAILIPAHDEQLLIGRLLESLAKVDYPKDRVDVHVVADNCTDATAALARAAGAIVHERFDREQQSKGFALRWLFEKLRQTDETYDAVVILDADSVVAPNLLCAMDARLSAGSQAVQAYYSVLNASASPVASLRYAALSALHYVRPLGRSVLRLSCGLKGNGMCFTFSLLEKFGWDWFTLAEDVEFHLALVRRQVRVDFAPETWVLADMPVTLQQAASQNDRWERGRLQMARAQIFGLLGAGIRERSPLPVDAAIEQLIPPISVPFSLGLVCLISALLLDQPLAAMLSSISLSGLLVHLLAGLVLVRAPRHAYVSLMYAPVYIVWKLHLYMRALVTARSTRWVRTVRAA